MTVVELSAELIWIDVQLCRSILSVQSIIYSLPSTKNEIAVDYSLQMDCLFVSVLEKHLFECVVRWLHEQRRLAHY